MTDTVRVYSLPNAVLVVTRRADRVTFDSLTPQRARQLAHDLLAAADRQPLCPTLAGLIEQFARGGE